MRKTRSIRGNQGGQVIVEYILMMVVVLTLSFMVQNFLKEKGFLKNLVFEPWARLNGMVQCGVWNPCGVEVAKGGLHPNAAERVLSYDPKN